MRLVSVGCFIVLVFAACSGGGGSSAQSDSVQDTGAGGDPVAVPASYCIEVICPPGTTRHQGVESCTENEALEIETDAGTISGYCYGTGSCAIACTPPEPCCDGEEWTPTSYSCEVFCPAACSCDGKCGTVSGPDCEADCGGCGGGQVCGSDNVCVDECVGGTATCAGSCCDTTEICYLNLCCDLAANCAGKMCGSDGCGGVCETQESIPGCAENETCSEGQCVASCEGMLPKCSVVAGEEVVMACDDSGEEVTWVPAENCAADATLSFCMNTALGATCVECLEPSDCAPGEACDAGGECI
jgi:hypothetical protein